ncbi:hypothetical protein BC835DRAFT_1422281 [Cytidiella melzeri]|nr:hypothetical protein BC835DRAFT_1422281 [Cytidiella melzeri]
MSAPTATQVSSTRPQRAASQSLCACLYAGAHHSTVSVLSYLTLTQEHCPPVLLKAFESLTNANYCSEWGECVAVFVKQQVALFFAGPNGNIILHNARPEVYKMWFKKGCLAHGPELLLHREFLNEMTAWWWAVQLDNQGDDGCAQPEESGVSDWHKTIKPGRNSVFLFLTGLMWVGCAMFEHSEDSLCAN